MSDELELTPAQAEAVEALADVIARFGSALELVRAADMTVVDALRAAGIEVPAFVPSSLLESLLAPAPA